MTKEILGINESYLGLGKIDWFRKPTESGNLIKSRKKCLLEIVSGLQGEEERRDNSGFTTMGQLSKSPPFL
jgi:hypothetical protein